MMQNVVEEMGVDPKVGSMIPEDLSTKCSTWIHDSIGAMVKFDSIDLGSHWIPR